ncbi:taurine catabolism dioxygenase TauD [Sedimentitalea sp. CY04]|uniref:Taurine catabolism dioxygenase TauD n=2 Tax=Parasedimentitalea denitrificans TaxID=2211118 RepID=A0ABX0WDL8_9RHOB|nr:taurine catabolism dioxygenase TauD [Sedimentitalea sp. CY04]
MADNPDAWLYQLKPEGIADLENAARHFLALELDVGEISKETFPLTTFSTHVGELSKILLTGAGVQVLRGLPIVGYSQKFAATIFCGLGAHLGSARSQNAQGHILGHVRDIGGDVNDPNSRIYQTCERQTFHTDSADVVGLLCLREAKEGGRSLLVSAVSIYNRMKAERPDLLAKLFDPIATDRRGEIPEGARPFMEIPVLNWHKGQLTVFYQRQYIDSAQRFDGAMPLTTEHVEALDMFDELANDPTLCFGMQLEPGDMQFVYNHSQLHDRTGFLDWPDPSKRRHLMRLWLSVDGDRPLPECFKERYGSIEIGNRGGIITKETKLHAPLD